MHNIYFYTIYLYLRILSIYTIYLHLHIISIYTIYLYLHILFIYTTPSPNARYDTMSVLKQSTVDFNSMFSFF